MRISRITGHIVGWSALAIASAGALLHSIGSSIRLVAAATAFAPVLMLAGLASIVAFAIMRLRAQLVGSVVIVGACVATQVPIFAASNADASGPEVTVMVSNVEFGQGETGALERAVAGGVDVLAVLELTPDAAARIDASTIGRTLPYKFGKPDIGAKGTAVWSRYPLRDGIILPDLALHGLRMTVDAPTQFTLFALHPLPPNQASDWSDELGHIRRYLREAPDGPVIAPGDYNATWDHKQFRQLLQKGYRDAAMASGDTPQFTWPTDRFSGPVVGIDHILLRRARSLSTRTIDIPGTDHRAVAARVRLP